MPIYEYSCRKCGHAFEVLIRSKSDLPDKCPKCGEKKPVKGFSAFAVGAAPTHTPAPCATGACPSAGGGGCSGGACPFSG